MKPLVYIAGPYSLPDPVLNTRRAIEVGLAIHDSGRATPVIPHLTLLAHLVTRRIALAALLAAGGCTTPAPTAPQPVPRTTVPPTAAPTTTTTAAPTSTTAAAAPRVTVVVAARPEPAPPSGSATGGTSATLACIRRWESGGDYGAVSPAGHAGAYQFGARTWRGAVARAGFSEWAGRPANEAPPHVQDAAAAQLLAERGLAPWPTPARRCA